MDLEDFSEITGYWDHKSLPNNIVVGQGCWIENKRSFERFRSLKQPGLTIGNRGRVYMWTTFNVEPTGQISIGDDSVLVGAVFMCSDHIEVGERVIISYNVTIADSDFHPHDPQKRRLDSIASSPHGDRSQRPVLSTRPVIIENDVWIGIGAIILKGVRVGQGAKVKAGAVVTTDVPSGSLVHGNPAKIVAMKDRS